jgi:23S rRNA pseudouridine2605 synthase
MPSVPLLKALARAGIGPRRWLAGAILQGRVQVNGAVVEDFGYPVNVETDRLLIDGQPVDLKPQPPVYLMLNKPRGILSTTRDERGRRTVMDILPQKYRNLRLYPVGRLDKDSTGLLLLTNDGELAHRVAHPRFEHEKEYLVYIDGSLKPDEKRRLERGLELEDGRTYPAKVREVSTPAPYNYSIAIHEGRKRQVRRMLGSLGHPVLALRRIRIGNLELGNLPEGDTRELSAQEVQAMLKFRGEI